MNRPRAPHLGPTADRTAAAALPARTLPFTIVIVLLALP